MRKIHGLFAAAACALAGVGTVELHELAAVRRGPDGGLQRAWQAVQDKVHHLVLGRLRLQDQARVFGVQVRQFEQPLGQATVCGVGGLDGQGQPALHQRCRAFLYRGPGGAQVVRQPVGQTSIEGLACRLPGDAPGFALACGVGIAIELHARAEHIVRACQGGGRRVVYPWPYRMTDFFIGFAVSITRAFSPMPLE